MGAAGSSRARARAHTRARARTPHVPRAWGGSPGSRRGTERRPNVAKRWPALEALALRPHLSGGRAHAWLARLAAQSSRPVSRWSGSARATGAGAPSPTRTSRRAARARQPGPREDQSPSSRETARRADAVEDGSSIRRAQRVRDRVRDRARLATLSRACLGASVPSATLGGRKRGGRSRYPRRD